MRLFISYAKPDWDHARALYTSLTSLGYDSWIDDENLVAGKTWRMEIEEAIQDADLVIFILSSSTVDRRGFFQQELRIAGQAMGTVPAGHIFLIPARFDQCQVPALLQGIHYVDMFPDYKAGLAKLL